MLKPKACVMTYWDGQKKTLQMGKRGSSVGLRQSLLSSQTNLDSVLSSKTWTSSKTITGARVFVNRDEIKTEFIK